MILLLPAARASRFLDLKFCRPVCPAALSRLVEVKQRREL